jgi:hypothetical protein
MVDISFLNQRLSYVAFYTVTFYSFKPENNQGNRFETQAKTHATPVMLRERDLWHFIFTDKTIT